MALLGARITVDQIGGLGWYTGALIVGGVVATIVIGSALARLLGLSSRIGILTGGATAICGASAAIAIAAVLPRDEKSERELIFTIAGVTALSTIAMILYPLIVGWAGLDPHQAGIFLGGTIHDVAQVVGAGYSISPDVGDYAVLTQNAARGIAAAGGHDDFARRCATVSVATTSIAAVIRCCRLSCSFSSASSSSAASVGFPSRSAPR